jgi:hypothetical protein
LRVADEQYGAIAGVRWRWNEHILDLEVSLRLGRDSTGVVGNVSTKECGEYGIFTCRPDVASSPNQAVPFYPDIPVRRHAGHEVTYDPRLPGGVDTTDNVRSKRRDVASHRNHPNAALESHERLSAHYGCGSEPYNEEHRNRYQQPLFHDIASSSRLRVHNAVAVDLQALKFDARNDLPGEVPCQVTFGRVVLGCI